MSFPKTIKLDETSPLRVDVHLHEFFLGDRDRQCWTYLTRGLKEHDQREMALSLLVEDGVDAEEFPRTPIRMFQQLASKTRDERLVDHGDSTRLGQTGIFGFPCLLYAPAVQYPDLPVLDDYLALILVHQAEYDFARQFGFTRFLSRLGRFCSSFPYPTWNTQVRPALVEADHRENSILANAGHPTLDYSCVHRTQNTLQFQLHRDDLPVTLETLRGVSGDEVAVFSTAFSPRCDATLYWQEGQEQPGSYATPTSDEATSVTGGSFVSMGAGDRAGISIEEDGYAVTLSAPDWQDFCKAVETGSAWECLFTGDDRFVLDLVETQAHPRARAWDPAALWRNQASSPEPGPGDSEDDIDEPQTRPPVLPPEPVDVPTVRAGRYINLSPDGGDDAGVTAEDLNQYIHTIERALDRAMADESASFQFDIELIISPAGVEPSLRTTTELNPAFVEFVENAIRTLPSCRVNATVKLRVPFSING